jgi:REP element-mobilizing transposase RayT
MPEVTVTFPGSPEQLVLPLGDALRRRRKRKMGRPRSPESGVSHARRGPLSHRHPVHVTLRVRPDVENLRCRRFLHVLDRALAAVHARPGLRIVHYSVQGNHLHLIAEAPDQPTLSRRMQGFTIRVAKRLNRELGRKGSVFADRYHARALRTPLEVRRAILYLFRNAHHHHLSGYRGDEGRGLPDAWSSAYYFDGFADTVWVHPLRDGPAGGENDLAKPAMPLSWLLATGWRKVHGLLHPREIAPTNDSIIERDCHHARCI